LLDLGVGSGSHSGSGYVEMIHLMSSSSLIITESGGIQKEAFILLHIQCLTLRYITEWPETVQLDANSLVGDETKLIIEKAFGIIDDEESRGVYLP